MFQTHSCAFFCEALRGHDLSGRPMQNSRVAGVSRLVLLASRCHTVLARHSCCHLLLTWLLPISTLQLSAMDVSVRSTMKGAAKCDKHCELQNSVNRQGLERILCFWDIPESMPASVSMLCCSSCCGSLWASFCDCLCLRMCLVALLRHLIDRALLQQPAY